MKEISRLVDAVCFLCSLRFALNLVPAILLLLCSTATTLAAEPQAKFCPQCADAAAARTVAESMAPPAASGPGCDDVVPQGGVQRATNKSNAVAGCTRVVRRVFIVNHLTGSVFAFDVWTEISAPVSKMVTMTPVQQLVTDRIVELRLAWDDFTQGAIVQPGEGLALRSYSASLRDVSGCPEGTALDAVLDPAILEDYKEMVNVAAVEGLPPFSDGQSWVSRLTGIGAQALGFGVSAQWESNGRVHTLYDFEFAVSEDPNPVVPDRLVFDVEMLGESQSGAPILDIEFNKAGSRAAGRAVTALENGGTVANECAVAKIEQALSERGFTFHYPPADSAPSPFPDYVGAGELFPICTKTITAKVNGVPQYTFTVFVPCNQP